MKIVLGILVALFLASGVLHLVNPNAFMWLMPPWMPWPVELIYVSGVFELVAAIGIIFRQRWAGLLAGLTLLAVWPANIWYALEVTGSGNTALIVAAWLRLPLQLPLIYVALKFAGIRLSARKAETTA
jgi:uncharacterized membrane protein